MTQATEKYKSKRQEIDNQIKALQEALIKMDESQDDNRLDWGYVGDVTYILEQLQELNQFRS